MNHTKLRKILLKCGPFVSDRELRAVFADARISPWQNSLPEANNPIGRVEGVIDYLGDQYNDAGENALTLLLHVLSERHDLEDACRQELANLASEFEVEVKSRRDTEVESRGQQQQPGVEILFGDYIIEKTRDFTGRKSVFNKIDEFIEQKTRGYVRITAEPGMGKTALAAELVRTRGYPHYFNRFEWGANKEKFIHYMCLQLVAKFSLNNHMPAGNEDFEIVLALASQKARQAKEKLIIVVDALDEADSTLPEGHTLNLPVQPPPNTFFIATWRKGANNVALDYVFPTREIIELDPNSEENEEDARKFLLKTTDRPGIQSYLNKGKVPVQQYIDELWYRSEGNFMYLFHVTKAIEAEDGDYKDEPLGKLPIGLKGYYQDHWRRMRIRAGDSWLNDKLMVIAAILEKKEGVTFDQIIEWTKIDRIRANEVLSEWSQFFPPDRLLFSKKRERCYRWVRPQLIVVG